ncbi:hypothetical protein OH799_28235 [Nocardia sp. NBC_00881]|nr:hypothetical protein OH799_28235 [Nocardia sp. NBC_00881]
MGSPLLSVVLIAVIAIPLLLTARSAGPIDGVLSLAAVEVLAKAK